MPMIDLLKNGNFLGDRGAMLRGEGGQFMSATGCSALKDFVTVGSAREYAELDPERIGVGSRVFLAEFENLIGE